jgi:hypothetical protein
MAEHQIGIFLYQSKYFSEMELELCESGSGCWNCSSGLCGILCTCGAKCDISGAKRGKCYSRRLGASFQPAYYGCSHGEKTFLRVSNPQNNNLAFPLATLIRSLKGTNLACFMAASLTLSLVNPFASMHNLFARKRLGLSFPPLALFRWQDWSSACIHNSVVDTSMDTWSFRFWRSELVA